VSFQITVLKVLAGHPEGRATLADLNAGAATRFDGLVDAPAARLNGFRRFPNSFRGLSQFRWRIGTAPVLTPSWARELSRTINGRAGQVFKDLDVL
jgi:hypothetical protein